MSGLLALAILLVALGLLAALAGTVLYYARELVVGDCDDD